MRNVYSWNTDKDLRKIHVLITAAVFLDRHILPTSMIGKISNTSERQKNRFCNLPRHIHYLLFCHSGDSTVIN